MLRYSTLAFALLTLPIGASAQPTQVDLSTVRVENDRSETTRLDRLIGAKTILHLWATWCRPCREELPELEAFADAYGLEEQLVLVSIDTMSMINIDAFLDDLDVDLPTYRQVKGNVGTALTILGYPSTLVVDVNGAVLFRKQGAVDWGDPDQAAHLLELLSP
ncbi:Thiol-disulfide isomerase or thioredoxin [Devosia crocina]|uniref:Thiol-disulfide isomerase or thioredoxin n=1 Tax=Devosia crocina TaxID=429728 RepID=A0A1I7NJ89_9HYPH|nr:TlpA disulfide reductase family protein [Devosia crocina]SFV34704.1 Thiol-disulfide isomerase or thioredoxin [Devosia crocina]